MQRADTKVNDLMREEFQKVKNAMMIEFEEKSERYKLMLEFRHKIK